MTASEFRAKCYAMLREVHATGEPVLVTKRGRAVARVAAAYEPPTADEPEQKLPGARQGSPG